MKWEVARRHCLCAARLRVEAGHFDLCTVILSQRGDGAVIRGNALVSERRALVGHLLVPWTKFEAIDERRLVQNMALFP
jgi:hypothetical protein